MRRIYILSLSIIIVTSCNSNQKKYVEPNWHDSIPGKIQIGALPLSTIQIDSILYPLRKDTDDINNIIFYTDRTTSRRATDKEVFIYIARDLKTGELLLRLKITYWASDWLFIKSYQFKCDTSVYEYRPENMQTRSDETIYEWSDEALNSSTYQILKAISVTGKCKLRSNGRQFYNDREMTIKEIAAIKNILILFEAANGKPPLN